MRDHNAVARPRTAPSSPRWRSRPSSANKVVFPRAGPSYLFDKALPPLPGAPNVPPILVSKSAAPTASAAAKPALGLGLTLDLPSTSLFDANTVMYDTPTSPTSNTASSMVRKAKSSQMLETEPTVEPTSSPRGHRRHRGLSFGSSTLLGFAGDLKTKGKEKDVDCGKASPNLTRKGSFWSRKRYLTHSPEPNVPSTPSSIAPTSPVYTSPPKKQSPSHVRGLSRSLSERSFLPRPSPIVSENVSSTTHLSPRHRPSSAKLPQSSNWGGFLHPSSKARNSKELNDVQQLSDSDRAQTTLRRRAQTNPPLLHRLSLNIFSFATSPPSPNPQNVSIVDLPATPSTEKLKTSVSKSPRDDESPAAYVQRLVSSVAKAEIAGILASSADLVYTQSLQIYIDRFDFVDDPLDIAMRKLLMHVGLPRETQQIDRVIEAFARRYRYCNPDLFTSDDHPYILAFSLIMLHTDAFNKSNKRKMTKADYVKNTKLPGVASDVLECFYDNIVFAPFIFIEDPLENIGQPLLSPDSRMFTSISTPSLVSNGNAGTLLKNNKIDPYYLIVHNLLSPLRINVHAYIPTENPYSYEGTMGPWDIDQLQHDSTSATVLLVDGLDQCQGSLDTHTGTYQSDVDAAGCFPHVPTSPPMTCSLRIIKVGLLNKKDDTSVGGKKAASRKWRPWTVVLTTSHLLFFRDLSFANTLCSYLEPLRERVKLPDSVAFKSDESLAICDSIAVYDHAYSKYPNALRFVMSDGRQALLQAPHEKEMNDWLAKINYTGTFRTSEIRVRPPSMTGKLVELTGVAAATSHLQDMQHRRRSTHLREWDNNASSESGDTLIGNSNAKHRVELKLASPRHDKFIAVAPEVEGADQFKATFDQVKADLAAGLSELKEKDRDQNNLAAATIPSEPHNGGIRLPSRAHVMQSKVESLQEDIAKTQSRIESDMRLVRSIALLTPFQKTSRDHLRTTLEVVGKRVAQLRIDLVKLLCYHDTLCRDLSSEVRSWGEAKKIAFQAAKQTLQKHYDAKQPFPMRTVTDSDSDTPKRESTDSSTHPSSPAESFHSAIDPGSDKLCSSEAIYPSPNGRHRDLTLETDATRNSTTSSIRLSSSDTSQDWSQADLTNSRPTQEEAEMWDKTRCAHRVSLVRVPSNLLLTRLPRGPST